MPNAILLGKFIFRYPDISGQAKIAVRYQTKISIAPGMTSIFAGR